METSIEGVGSVVDTVIDKCTQNKTDINSLDAKLAEMGSEMKKAEKIYLENIQKLQENVLDLKCRSMKYNLVFSGLAYQNDENVTEKIRVFIKNELGILHHIDFVNVHRFGSPGLNNARPIVAKFSYRADLEAVLKNAYRLKGKRFGINEQFPKEIENRRKALYPVMRKAKGEGKKVSMVRDRLYIDGKLVQIEEGTVEGEKSRETSVDSGVPQGTVLGPIMFLCHINDLPDCVNSSVRLFADDCLLYRTIKKEKDHQTLQTDLNNLEQWANDWGMRFNAKKCYIMSINQKTSKFYELNNHILQEVKDNPYLGLQISNDLKWGIHINNVCNKANATLGFIRRNLRNVPESCRKTAYISLVRSVMEYGATIWNPYLQGDIDKLERIQNRAVRFIKKDYKSRDPGSITSMKKDLEIDTLEERRLSLRLILMYKVVEGLAPALPTDKFVQFSKRKRQIKPKQFADHISTNIVDKRVCNNSKGLELPSCRTPQYKHSFFVDTVIHWNHLPDSVVHADSVEAFKTALRNQRQ